VGIIKVIKLNKRRKRKMRKWIVNSTESGKFTSKVIGWFPNEAVEQDIINYLHSKDIKVNANDYRINIKEE